MSQTVGFIGLGVMGKPMANHVQAKGYSLVVSSRSRRRWTSWSSSARVRARRPPSRARRDHRHHDAAGHAGRRARARGAGGRDRGPRARRNRHRHEQHLAGRDATARREGRGGRRDDARRAGERRRNRRDRRELSIMVGGDAAAFESAARSSPAWAIPIASCTSARAGRGSDLQGLQSDGDRRRAGGRRRSDGPRAQGRVDPALVRQALLGGFAASRVLEVHGERMLTKN